MKILLVHNYYQSSQKGGEDRVFSQEVAACKKLLGEKNVLTYTASNDLIKKWQLPFTIWSSRKHAKSIKALCQQHAIDLVHVHNFFPLLTTSIFVAAKKAGCKVVHTLHNYRWWCLNGTLFDQTICHQCVPKRFAFFGVMKGCYRGSRFQSLLAAAAFAFYKRKKVRQSIDAYFALSYHQKAMVRSFMPNAQIWVKPNGVDLSPSLTQERRGYVFVGRLEKGKGIEKVLEAWEHLDETFPLTIIGTGELEASLKKRYQAPHIRFLGTQTSEKVKQLLAGAKYCLHPSLYYETFGLVIIEAMSQGTPVIGFNIGTRPELIKHGVNGFIVTPETLFESIRALDGWLGYPKMSENALKSAKKYQMEKNMLEQVNLYQKVLENHD